LAGKKLGATTVILPVLTFTRGSEVFFKLIKVDSDKVVESSELKVALATPSLEDLKAGEVYGSLNPRALTTTEPTYVVGPKHPEVKFPECFYTPYPPYSDSAKGLHFGVIVFIEAIISKDGHVEDPRVVRGLPFDLNEMALKTIATWRCRPAVLDGNPVRTTIPFEITFRPN
jgi:Gram-negative bacterial TonB protein C-terminal